MRHGPDLTDRASRSGEEVPAAGLLALCALGFTANMVFINLSRTVPITVPIIVGIVRAVMEWPSYELSMLDEKPVPVIAGVIPGKNASPASVSVTTGWRRCTRHRPSGRTTACGPDPSSLRCGGKSDVVDRIQVR